MRISGIEVIDTYGTPQFKVGPFSVLRISGKNGLGKSSIIRSLDYLLGGGNDPSVIRKWCDGTSSPNPNCKKCGGLGCYRADQSVVRLNLDSGAYYAKTTRPKKNKKTGEITGYVADLEGFSPDGTVIPAPQTHLNELATSLAANPATILSIDTSKVPGRRALAAELQKLAPISFTPEEVNRAVSYRSNMDAREPDAIALPQSPEIPWGLDELKKAAASVTEQRRREGQTKNDTDGAINRLQKALPESSLPAGDQYAAEKAALCDEKAMRAALEEAEDYRRTVESAIAEAKLETEKQRGVSIQEAVKAESIATQQICDEIDSKIRALEAEKSERIAAARAEREKAKEAANVAARDACVSIDSEAAPQLEKAIADVTTAKDRIAAHARAATLREEIEVQLATHRAASWKYDQLSAVLQRLESLRLEKLQNLPVAGLTFDDGYAYLDGIPWENVNTARRVEAVLQICCMQTGKLPLIMIDDCEHLDEETRSLIEAGLIEAGYQIVECSVSQGPLTIETINTPELVSQ